MTSPLRPGAEFTFCLWTSALVRMILKSGTSFGAFLKNTLQLPRGDGHSAPTALFPLPLLCPMTGCLQAVPHRRTQRCRLPHLCKVAVHVLVMALSFLFTGGKHVPPEALRRLPSTALMGFVRASARLSGTTLQQGQKGLQLAVCQVEVLQFL